MEWTGDCWQSLEINIDNCSGSIFFVSSGKYLYFVQQCETWEVTRTTDGINWEDVSPQAPSSWDSISLVNGDMSQNSTGDLVVTSRSNRFAFFDGSSKQWFFNLEVNVTEVVIVWDRDIWTASITGEVLHVIGIHLEENNTQVNVFFEKNVDHISAQGVVEMLVSVKVT
jgi:hypothetical protein